MLCQNCKRNDASVHLKRIINGEAAEIHLCGGCAASLGVSETVSGFMPFSDFLGGILSSSDTRRISNKVLRCETCGFSFDDIAKTGFAGCPDCYRVFNQKLRPTLRKIHGSAVYKGKSPVRGKGPVVTCEEKAEALRRELEKAVAEQNFEYAAVLRDEILKITEKEEQ